MHDIGAIAPSSHAVRAAVGRLARSATLRRSPQLTTLLRFVVNAALGGGTAELKEYTIAVDGFGRGTGFDPARSAFVRVMASRLRSALRHYYEGEGAADPLVVEVPVGTYSPQFFWRDARLPGATAGDPPVEPGPRAAAGAALSPPMPLVLSARLPDGETALRDHRRLREESHRLAAVVHAQATTLQEQLTATALHLAQARMLLARLPPPNAPARGRGSR